MIRIRADLLLGMVEHSLQLAPIEACGFLVGPKGGDPAELWPMLNVLASESRYAFDPDRYLAAYARMDALGYDPLVIYHSHTASPAEPSRYDIAHAWERKATYVIVSTASERPGVRAWRPEGAGLVEVPIEVTDPA